MLNLKAELDRNKAIEYLWNPPGGILVWLFVLAELLFFGVGFFMLATFRQSKSDVFNTGQSQLNLSLGIFLTLTLLISGWQLAEFVHCYFNAQKESAKKHFLIAFIFGLIFIVTKSFDFYHKIKDGLVLGKNDFWDFYWLFTGFHFLHVLLGMIILSIVRCKLPRNNFEDIDFAIRGSANFWHMCDVIWLFMFPLFYIGKAL